MLCEYGCGNEAKFQIGKQKKWCCSESYNSCPNMKKKNSDGNRGNTQPIPKKIENTTNIMCSFGCGNPAVYQFETKNYCCSKYVSSCPGLIRKKSEKERFKPVKIENPEGLLCDYGCGNSAKYLFSNKKICCNDNYLKCEISKKKNSGRQKYIKIENPEGKLCDYGCGLKAEYENVNGKLCCSEFQTQCPVNSKKTGEGNKGVIQIRSKKIENPEGKLCDYGCGLKAEYELGNKKLCCSESHMTCPINRDKHSKSLKSTKIENQEGLLCDYGCGLKAEYENVNGKLCCSEFHTSCLKMKEKNGEAQKSIKIENLENKLCDYGCGLKAQYILVNRKFCCNEYHTSCRAISYKIGKALENSIEEWQTKYPTFAKVEEMRYNPDKPGEKEIQVHCKNHNCPNSKEKGGWFTLTKGQFAGRVASLEHPLGNDGNYFYCSDECKHSCPLFHMRVDPYRDKELYYTDQEYDIFKQEVLKKDNYICFFCGKNKATIVHHTRPQKLEPFFALDPDYGISVCIDCHHFIHRSKEKGGECSTGNLANIVCTPKQENINDKNTHDCKKPLGCD